MESPPKVVLKPQRPESNSTPSSHKCAECGFVVLKPSLLAQHMLAHSNERPFCCPVEGCTSTYKRPDHLNRHLRKHNGKMLRCPWTNCKLQCTNKSNFKRHLRRHDEKGSLQRCRDRSMDKIKIYRCECGKEFRNLSALQYHRDTAHVIWYAEIICSEVGCYETFSDAASLKEHARLSHRYAICEVCGKSFLKRNLRRHYEAHNGVVKQSFYCPYENCSHSYTRKSNLTSHIKAVHLQVKPYSCSFENCRKRFAFKNVRDNHEKTAAHLPRLGDFISEEKKLLLKPKGGRKRMVIRDIGVEHVLVVIDNAMTCMQMGEILTREHPSIVWTPCAAHSVDLIHNLCDLAWIRQITSQAMRMVSFVTKKKRVLALFRTFSPLDLRKPTPTRFAYYLLVLERLLAVRFANIIT